MRRWQLTAVMVVLAAAGISLATGLPVGIVAIRWLTPDPIEVADLVGRGDPVEPVVDARTARPGSEELLIPELSDPVRPEPPVRSDPPPVVHLPPDPVPVHYGCGGSPVPIDQPVPVCGMG